MTASFPPIRREPRVDYRPLKPEDGKKAVELVREALLFFRAGEPIIYPDHVDVPVFYLNFAIDRVRYDENWGQYRGERHRRGLSGQPHSPQDSKGWGGALPPPFRSLLSRGPFALRAPHLVARDSPELHTAVLHSLPKGF